MKICFIFTAFLKCGFVSRSILRPTWSIGAINVIWRAERRIMMLCSKRERGTHCINLYLHNYYWLYFTAPHWVCRWGPEVRDHFQSSNFLSGHFKAQNSVQFRENIKTISEEIVTLQYTHRQWKAGNRDSNGIILNKMTILNKR